MRSPPDYANDVNGTSLLLALIFCDASLLVPSGNYFMTVMYFAISGSSTF